ncbi:MAG: hypothetical protein AAFV43_06040 [Planctomycetota bacterium]
MRGLLFVIASFGVTILAWGLYGPTLHVGQADMSTVPGQYARLRPFICVGLAYFAIGVIVPAVILLTRGEKGAWTGRGAGMSLLAGAFGAIGALGIIMAFTFGGRPSYVMPLVFGGAPVVNAFLTIYWSKKVKEVGPLFLAGLVMVVLGAATVLICKPGPPAKTVAQLTSNPVTETSGDAASVEEKAEPVAEQVVANDASASEPASAESVAASGDANADTKADEPLPAEATETATDIVAAPAVGGVTQAGFFGMNFLAQVLSIATVVACWGAYGPVLHVGQAAMQQSRLRPLLCVGLAYFAIAVVGPWLLLQGPLPEASEFNVGGSLWSMGAGAAGAIGALGIIMAFNFGGKPMYVMPLVFGGAPVVNTFATIIAQDQLSNVNPFFLAGLILVIAGAAMVLVFAPKGPPPKKAPAASPKVESNTPPTAERNPVTSA